MDVSAAISGCPSLLGEWLDIELPEGTSWTQRQQLLEFYGAILPMRMYGDALQAFKPDGQDLGEVLRQIHQFLADIDLRDRIAERCVVAMDTLVQGVLCRRLQA